MTPAYTFPTQAFTFLPLLSGNFAVASDRPHAFRLELSQLGDIFLPSGQLVIADPFVALRHEGNPFLIVPPGHHVVGQTWHHDEHGGTRVAYISLILQPARLKERRRWQQQQIARGQSPSLPEDHLRLLHLTVDGLPLREYEASEADLVEQVGIALRSGTLAMAAPEAILSGLPPDLLTHPDCPEALDWYDHYQAHDVPGSWLDTLDESGLHRTGGANIGLPRNPQCRMALSYAGWSSRAYPVIGEYSRGESDAWARPADELVAIHVDLRLVGAPWAGPAGWGRTAS